MSNSQEKSLHAIIDAWSPITRGKKGLLGAVLKAVAKPLEILRNVLGAMARFPIAFGYENTAGQVLSDCPAVVADTFRRMEKKLQTSFNTAARGDASPIERETFLRLADKVRIDGAALSKHCTILRTEFSNVTEGYSFIVAKEPQGNRVFRTTTLEQGVTLVKELINGATEKAAGEIASGAKNPVTILRRPIELQSRSQQAS